MCDVYVQSAAVGAVGAEGGAEDGAEHLAAISMALYEPKPLLTRQDKRWAKKHKRFSQKQAHTASLAMLLFKFPSPSSRASQNMTEGKEREVKEQEEQQELEDYDDDEDTADQVAIDQGYGLVSHTEEEPLNCTLRVRQKWKEQRGHPRRTTPYETRRSCRRSFPRGPPYSYSYSCFGTSSSLADDEKRQLELALRLSRTQVNDTGIRYSELEALLYRELSPNDYELLSRLDEAVPKKTLPKSHLSSLPIFPLENSCAVSRTLLNASERCSVCLCEYAEHEEVSQLGCLHVFHAQCVTDWLAKQSVSCPLCKVEVVVSNCPPCLKPLKKEVQKEAEKEAKEKEVKQSAEGELEVVSDSSLKMISLETSHPDVELPITSSETPTGVDILAAPAGAGAVCA